MREWVVGLSGSDYQAAFDVYAKQGYRPVFVTYDNTGKTFDPNYALGG